MELHAEARVADSQQERLRTRATTVAAKRAKMMLAWRTWSLVWGMFTHYADFVLDVLVLRDFFQGNRMTEATVSIAILVLCGVMSSVAMLWDGHRNRLNATRWDLILAAFLQFVGLQYCVETSRSWRSVGRRKTQRLRTIKWFSSILEAMPQALLQSVVLFRAAASGSRIENESLLVLSICSSFAQASWSICVNEPHSMRSFRYLRLLLCFRLSEIMSRTLSLAALSALTSVGWTGTLVACDWIVISLLIYSFRRTHTYPGTNITPMSAGIFGIVWVFVFFVGLSQRPFYVPHVAYYTLRALDVAVVLGAGWGAQDTLVLLMQHHSLAVLLVTMAACVVVQFVLLPHMLERAEQQYAQIRGNAGATREHFLRTGHSLHNRTARINHGSELEADGMFGTSPSSGRLVLAEVLNGTNIAARSTRAASVTTSAWMMQIVFGGTPGTVRNATTWATISGNTAPTKASWLPILVSSGRARDPTGQ